MWNKILAPLNNMTGKKQTFHWSTDAENGLLHVRKLLADKTLLVHFEIGKSWMFRTYPTSLEITIFKNANIFSVNEIQAHRNCPLQKIESKFYFDLMRVYERNKFICFYHLRFCHL